MFTRWYSPKIVAAQPSDEIGWQGSITGDVSTNYVSLDAVRSVARSQGGLVQTGTQSLVFRDFGIQETGTVAAVEIELRVDRLSRIQDRTIRLWQGREIGRNRADLAAEDLWVYSGNLSWWGVTALSVNDPDFGVLVDLQPHSQYPSFDSVYVRSLKIRIDFH